MEDGGSRIEDRDLLSAIFYPRPSIFYPRSSIFHPRPSIFYPRSSILDLLPSRPRMSFIIHRRQLIQIQMRVTLCRRQARVAEQLLNHPEIRAAIQ